MALLLLSTLGHAISCTLPSMPCHGDGPVSWGLQCSTVARDCPQHCEPVTAPEEAEAQPTSKNKVLYCGASVLWPTLGKGTNLAQQEHKDTNKLCPFVYSYGK